MSARRELLMTTVETEKIILTSIRSLAALSARSGKSENVATWWKTQLDSLVIRDNDSKGETEILAE